MKTAALACLALVIGFVLGSWGPRGQILDLQAQVERMKEEARRGGRPNAADGLAALLSSPKAPSGRGAPPAPSPRVPAAGGPADGTGAQPQAGDPSPEGGAPEPDAGTADSPSAGTGSEEMRALLDARRRQALEALKEQADLEADQVARVQAIVDRMNKELDGIVEDFVQDVNEAGAISRRAAMEASASALDTFLQADDQFRDTLTPEQYAQTDGEALDPTAYVEYDAVARLQKVLDANGGAMAP